MTGSTQMSSARLKASLDLFEVKPGLQFSLAVLQDILPDAETVIFFGKVYGLDAGELGHLLLKVLNTDLAQALFGEGHDHSNYLQDYLCEGYFDEWGDWHPPIVEPLRQGEVKFSGETVPKGEILPEVWKQLEVEVVQSIKDVAAKLESVVNMLPGKQGQMMFRSMMTMNAKRPLIGDYKGYIHHPPVKENLLILDVSGSMNEGTVKRIIDDVVALSYVANAHMAVVSNDTTYWAPGSYSVAQVLSAATYGGTHYETLAPLFDGTRDWGTVITVADYDSSRSAKSTLVKKGKSHIDLVLDVSLVNQPTFMAECIGHMADEVRPILIGSSHYVLT